MLQNCNRISDFIPQLENVRALKLIKNKKIKIVLVKPSNPRYSFPSRRSNRQTNLHKCSYHMRRRNSIRLLVTCSL
jgi:hypothetical protein